MEKSNRWGTRLNMIVAGINLAAFIFYAGVTWSRITWLEGVTTKTSERMDILQNTGTMNFQRYQAQNDAEISATKSRLTAVELAAAATPIIQADLRVINGKLDNLKEQLLRHEREANSP